MYKLNILIKYYDKEFLICNELDLKNLFKSCDYMRYMICSDNSRCKNFNLIEVDNMFFCKSCNVIFNKPFKIVINCCKKDSLIDDQVSPIVKL